MILHEFLSYETLRLIWWLLVGVLLIGFALTDGFDMGAQSLLPFVADSDAKRRVVINTMGPVWEGNQVWFILGGGAIFAAWPPLYAVSFSGFYLAMFMVLLCLIVRPVAFKYRSKRDDVAWRARWDWTLCIAGAVPALLFGVAMGNVIQGVPFRFTDDLHVIYEGIWYNKFIGLLDPFSLLAGIVSLSMLVMHGAAWLNLKTEGDIQARARRYGCIAAVVACASYAAAGVWMAYGIEGYRLTGEVLTNGPSNPLHFVAERTPSWFTAYEQRPWAIFAPILGLVGPLLVALGLNRGWELPTMAFSKLSVFGVIASVGLVMFPFMLPSSIDARSSLTIWNSSSSHLTLFIMLVCSVIFLPIILAYTAWVYHVLWGKVTEDEVSDNSHTMY